MHPSSHCTCAWLLHCRQHLPNSAVSFSAEEKRKMSMIGYWNLAFLNYTDRDSRFLALWIDWVPISARPGYLSLPRLPLSFSAHFLSFSERKETEKLVSEFLSVFNFLSSFLHQRLLCPWHSFRSSVPHWCLPWDLRCFWKRYNAGAVTRARRNGSATRVPRNALFHEDAPGKNTSGKIPPKHVSI